MNKGVQSGTRGSSSWRVSSDSPEVVNPEVAAYLFPLPHLEKHRVSASGAGAVHVELNVAQVAVVVESYDCPCTRVNKAREQCEQRLQNATMRSLFASDFRRAAEFSYTCKMTGSRSPAQDSLFASRFHSLARPVLTCSGSISHIPLSARLERLPRRALFNRRIRDGRAPENGWTCRLVEALLHLHKSVGREDGAEQGVPAAQCGRDAANHVVLFGRVSASVSEG